MVIITLYALEGSSVPNAGAEAVAETMLWQARLIELHCAMFKSKDSKQIMSLRKSQVCNFLMSKLLLTTFINFNCDATVVLTIIVPAGLLSYQL